MTLRYEVHDTARDVVAATFRRDDHALEFVHEKYGFRVYDTSTGRYL